MTTATATRPVPVRIAHSTPVATGDMPGTVRGLAIPFNDRNGVSGMIIDEDGGLNFYEYTLYAPGAFASQIEEPSYGGRVRFMWNHGGAGNRGWATGADLGTVPIGNVTLLKETPAGVMFAASFNETDMAKQVATAVGNGSVTDVSVLTENQVGTIKKDASGVDYLHVTQARLWDVSLVTRGHYAGTRIFSAHCAGCDSDVRIEPDPSDAHGRTFRAVHTAQGADHAIVVNSVPTGNAADDPPNDDPSGRDGETVTLTRVQVGALYAYINDQEHRLRNSTPIKDGE